MGDKSKFSPLMQSCVADVAEKKGGDLRAAFAICTASLGKRRSRDKRLTKKKDGSAVSADAGERYEKTLERARGGGMSEAEIDAVQSLTEEAAVQIVGGMMKIQESGNEDVVVGAVDIFSPYSTGNSHMRTAFYGTTIEKGGKSSEAIKVAKDVAASLGLEVLDDAPKGVKVGKNAVFFVRGEKGAVSKLKSELDREYQKKRIGPSNVGFKVPVKSAYVGSYLQSSVEIATSYKPGALTVENLAKVGGVTEEVAKWAVFLALNQFVGKEEFKRGVSEVENSAAVDGVVTHFKSREKEISTSFKARADFLNGVENSPVIKKLEKDLARQVIASGARAAEGAVKRSGITPEVGRVLYRAFTFHGGSPFEKMEISGSEVAEIYSTKLAGLMLYTERVFGQVKEARKFIGFPNGTGAVMMQTSDAARSAGVVQKGVELNQNEFLSAVNGQYSPVAVKKITNDMIAEIDAIFEKAKASGSA